MKKIYSLVIFSFLICFTATTSAQFGSYGRYESRRAAGKSVKLFNSFQVMFVSYVPYKNTSEISLSDPRYFNQPNSTKTFSNTQDMGWVLAAGASAYYNMFHLNENSAISLVFGMEAAAFANTIKDVETATSTTDVSLSQFRIGFPIALAFKHGGEVSYDKKDNFSFTAGLGIMPAMEPAVITGATDYYQKFNLTSNTFLFTEIGIHAFLEWKLRFALYPQGFKSFTVNSTIDDNFSGLAENVKFTSNGTGQLFQISFAFMPFSYGWEKN